jgi:hypothetical protein
MLSACQERLSLRTMLAALALSISMASGAFAAPPLHERIDAEIEAAHVGPFAPVTSDAEFIRRVSIDLVGMVPTAAEARAFISDPAPNKRAALVDRMLASPEYARNFALLFDSTLMERRGGSQVPSDQWHEFLRQSFEANKPYDQLAREILAADGAEPARAPAKFYLDRGGEVNLLTRDVGRVFFGMDLQCAQCHNHPAIDDYLQADYYGLSAFLNRSFLFNEGGAKAKNKLSVFAEKADGEVSFKSVFTGESADKVVPQLPKGATMVEPTFAKGQEYVVAPAKDVRPVPKFSRRAQLAALATNGRNAAFNRNIVNRLWAHMMGRGLVHPLDMHHPANPPSHPALLALLADDFVARKYDIKSFLRELALSKTYQRSCDLPSPTGFDFAQVAKRLETTTKEHAALVAAADKSKAASEKATSELAEARKAVEKLTPEAAKLQAAVDALRPAAEKAAGEVEAAKRALATKEEAAQAVAEASAKAKLAAAKVAGDKVLAQAAQQIESRLAPLNAEVAALKKTLETKTTTAKTATDQLEKAKQAASKPVADLTAARTRASSLEARSQAVSNQSTTDRMMANAAAERLADLKALVEYEKLAKSKPADAPRAWSLMAERWNSRFASASLKPIAPEQLAWSMMQAVGLIEPNRGVALTALKAKAEKEKKTLEAAEQARELENAVYGKLNPNVAIFVTLFGAGAGQPQDFQSSVGQALFLANADLLQGWLKPATGNLTDRLTKTSDPIALGDELFLSVYTRLPTDRERTEIADYLKGRDQDRPAAIGEMIWALLSSAEFRFNH